jgi:hypothetical protein
LSPRYLSAFVLREAENINVSDPAIREAFGDASDLEVFM